MDGARVVAVSRRPQHQLAKTPTASIRLIAGEGVEGDAHRGAAVQHLSRVARDPTAPNLRQVHLLHIEMLEELSGAGFGVGAGDIGENILTRGVDLLALPCGALLQIGQEAIVKITGLRSPCMQLNGHTMGLMNALIDRAADDSLVRKAGVMAVVVASGSVRAGETLVIRLPDGPLRPLAPV